MSTTARPSAATEVTQWLERFDSALQAGDAAAAADLFATESYWRDLVAFTWNIRTVEGPEGVADMLAGVLAAHPARAAGTRPRSRAAPTASPRRGSASRPTRAEVAATSASSTAGRGRC